MKKKNVSKKDPAQEATRLGEEAAQKENYKKAQDYFNQALKHDPQYEPAFINLASVAIKEGSPNIASRYFETIAKLAIEKHLYVKGIAALKRALQYDPTNQMAQERLINILRIQYGTENSTPEIASSGLRPPRNDEAGIVSTPVIASDVAFSPQLLQRGGKQSPLRNDDARHCKQREVVSTRHCEEDRRSDEAISGEFNLADLSEDEIDVIAEVEVLISEGAFDEASNLLSPLNVKYSNNKYIKLLVNQIENRDISVKSFIPIDSKEPEIDLSGALK